MNPEIARFYQDYIPFTRYELEQLEPDYPEQFKTDEELEIARNNVVIDNYREEDSFTPENWEKKLLGVDKTKYFDYINAFRPEYDKKECDRIEIAKTELCKEYVSSGKCTNKDSYEELMTKHDEKMRCRNIRAIESFSNCRNVKYNRWIKSNAIQHTKQMNNLARGAYKCVDIYRHKKKNSSAKRKKSKGRKSISRGR